MRHCQLKGKSMVTLQQGTLTSQPVQYAWFLKGFGIPRLEVTFFLCTHGIPIIVRLLLPIHAVKLAM